MFFMGLFMAKRNRLYTCDPYSLGDQYIDAQTGCSIKHSRPLLFVHFYYL